MSAGRRGTTARGAASAADGSPCFFCARLREGVPRYARVHDDPLVQVTHWSSGEGPGYLGALVLQTKRHTPAGLASLTDTEGRRIGELVARLSRALHEVAGAEWTYTYAFTEGFRHVHQFVLARYPRTPKRYLRLRVSDWPEAPRGGTAEVGRLTRALRAHLARGSRGAHWPRVRGA